MLSAEQFLSSSTRICPFVQAQYVGCSQIKVPLRILIMLSTHTGIVPCITINTEFSNCSRLWQLNVRYLHKMFHFPVWEIQGVTKHWEPLNLSCVLKGGIWMTHQVFSGNWNWTERSSPLALNCPRCWLMHRSSANSRDPNRLLQSLKFGLATWTQRFSSSVTWAFSMLGWKTWTDIPLCNS